MLKHNKLRAAVFAALALPLAAQAQNVTVEELLKRLEAQEQKIQALEQKLEAKEETAASAQGAAPTAEEQQQQILVLERKIEIQEEAAAAAKESTPVVSAGPKGFSLRSADGKNQIKLCAARMHLDGRYLPDDDHGVIDTFQATRVRPTIEGTFAGIYDFRFMPDFGQGRTRDPGRLCHGALQPGRPADARQVQVAGRPRAPAVGERHEVGAARLPDQPRAEPRHRHPARRRPRQAAASPTRPRS